MDVDKVIEIVSEMTILAMVMFLAAFFCLKTLFVPDLAEGTINKVHEVEKTISEGK